LSPGTATGCGYPSRVLRTVRIGVAAALLAAVLVLAGCGGSDTLSKQEYTDAVSNTRDRVDYALTQITVGHGTTQVLIDRMENASKLVEEAADDLDGKGSAAGFEDETDRLVQAFRDLATQLDATASDASQPGMEHLLDARALEFPGWTTANHILAKLKQQGIAVEPIGSH